MDSIETLNKDLRKKEETIALTTKKEAKTDLKVIREEISIQEMKDKISGEMTTGMAKDISSEEMGKTEVSSEGMEGMEDFRDATTRMEGIREKMTRMSKIGRMKIGVHLKSATRIKSQWRR